MSICIHRAARVRHACRAQCGQALIHGIFVLMTGAAALLFLFNTGQLSSEKTRLVNAADAVAYSAGAMHARVLNFHAYANRALMANEVAIAQMVSLASWGRYAQDHVDHVPMMNCKSQYSVPVALAMVSYIPLCYAISNPAGAQGVSAANQVIQAAAPLAVEAAELAKLALQAAQLAANEEFIAARQAVMQEVADANYAGEGRITVDAEALSDSYRNVDGSSEAGAVRRYAGDDRARLRDAVVAAADKDGFVRQRAWTSSSPWGCSAVPMPRGELRRTGGTSLIGFDEWRAVDNALFRQEVWNTAKWTCDGSETTMGDASQSARVRRDDEGVSEGDFGTAGSASSTEWRYSGLPSFFELAETLLDEVPDDPDASRREPRIRLAVRVVRDKAETASSTGRASIRPQGRLALFQGSEAGDELAAVSTSEVSFSRPLPRADGRQELASLFNPFWQARLVASSAADIAAARKRQTEKTR
ncbi:pilus assembly protein TadG-related protein [Noviherbaspirillum galbum]|uniref:Putative Flp pilus-assembly TadG-like N-terminal domain-containing protein n=1 Tax=Noviherbaspirillum galbum TaxID=2709383 RepID=A0A6B3SK27_9BURK|nr:pilus assembly protein TadG-related protein [Noviherbaspirillum galbum]NEX61127.1 hypothetical protein [Noviherbaspirillum galbum]